MVKAGEKPMAFEIRGQTKSSSLPKPASKAAPWSSQPKTVAKPVAVRYMFTNDGVGNVFSKEGLPVAPFRSDTW
ncbi:MAG: hypothetical protein IPK21_21650 [Haliscomenobacter sp.]|nr:hypothetical protein [Haliscomenobacter sp.]